MRLEVATMREAHWRRQTAWGVVWAMLLIAAGVILLLDRLGMVEVRDLWQLWPLGLIALGIGRLVDAVLWNRYVDTRPECWRRY